jgi:hypothetical protein
MMGTEREEWVLVMDQRDAPEGRNWFKQWAGIGPEGTWTESEAATFSSRQEAMQSPAFSFALTFYTPELRRACHS